MASSEFFRKISSGNILGALFLRLLIIRKDTCFGGKTHRNDYENYTGQIYIYVCGNTDLQKLSCIIYRFNYCYTLH